MTVATGAISIVSKTPARRASNSKRVKPEEDVLFLRRISGKEKHHENSRRAYRNLLRSRDGWLRSGTCSKDANRCADRPLPTTAATQSTRRQSSLRIGRRIHTQSPGDRRRIVLRSRRRGPEK